MYTHTSIPYPAPHDTYCRDCQRPIAQGELIRRRVLDAGGVAFEEHLLCGEPSSDCTPNQGSINHMQEEMRRDRLDERVAELEARLERTEQAYRAACSDSAKFAGERNDAQAVIKEVRHIVNSLGVTPYNSHRHMIIAIRALLEGRS